MTAALALARNGFRVTVLEQAEKLEPVGAGIQLSPSATRVMMALGLGERLASTKVSPEAIRIMDGGSGNEIIRVPFRGEHQYDAPFWAFHRGDLQGALGDAVAARKNITLKLGVKVEGFASHGDGVRVAGKRGDQRIEERGAVLVGADGIWSNVATRLGQNAPRFAHRTAWRALVPAESVTAEFRAPLIHLWVGSNAHLVHYPVQAGRLINVVGIVRDEWHGVGWSASGERDTVLRPFTRGAWAEKARALIAVPDNWQKWALYESKTVFGGGNGPVTLIGDAAHPMLPFLALGAVMAIEDAVVLADCLSRHRDNPARALRHYEETRRARTARAQRTSARLGYIYGMSGPEAFVRNMVVRVLGGERLLRRYDWLYSWQPPISA